MKLEPCPMIPMRRTMGKPDPVKYRIGREHYEDSLYGCFLGKNIGGTAGAPMEWQRRTNEFSGYQQELHGEPYPNDDLDLQLLSLIALEEKGLSLTSEALCEYWLNFLTPNWAEYGNAKANMRRGMTPPYSGSWLNEHKNSNGAFVRSEIWATICPGAPEIAVRYAYQDAILDHGNGEGLYAMLFVAAMESAAFVEHDWEKLLEIGLSFIPEDCRVAQAVRFTWAAWKENADWRDLREQILKRFRGSANNANPEMGDPQQRRDGWMDGEIGMDAPSAMAFLTAGLLYSGGDTDKLLKIVIYYGDDTDCTAATGCAICGIIGGPSCFAKKWTEPIGEKIKTMCLNVGDLGEGGRDLPQTVPQLVKRLVRLGTQVGLAYQRALDIAPQAMEMLPPAELLHGQDSTCYTRLADGPVYHGGAFDAQLLLENGPFICSGESKRLTVNIENHSRAPQIVELRVWCDAPLAVISGAQGAVTLKTPYMHGATRRGVSQKVEIRLQCEQACTSPMRGVILLSSSCGPMSLALPFTLLNGDMENTNPDPYYVFSKESEEK